MQNQHSPGGPGGVVTGVALLGGLTATYFMLPFVHGVTVIHLIAFARVFYDPGLDFIVFWGWGFVLTLTIFSVTAGAISTVLRLVLLRWWMGRL